MLSNQTDFRNLFFQFIEQNNITHLKKLMATINEEKINMVNKDRLTPLMFAAQNIGVCSETIKELLTKFDLNAKNDKGQTALQIALEANNLLFIETCLDAKLSSLSPSDANHLLIYFAKLNQVNRVGQLLKIHSVDINFKEKMVLLH